MLKIGITLDISAKNDIFSEENREWKDVNRPQQRKIT